MLKIRQVDKIFCCLLLTSTYIFFKKMHLSVVDLKKKTRAEERARESQNAKEKNDEDYAWKDLCEDSTKLKKLRVPELNKYLKHHRLDKHVKSTKNDKVQVITKHWLFQMNPIGSDLLQTGLRERDEAENEPLIDSDRTTIAVKMTTVAVKAALMRRIKIMTLTLVIETS